MPGLVLRHNESFEEAYRKFKKQIDRNLIVTETRARRFYEPMTEKRKKQKISAKKKMLKRLSRGICFSRKRVLSVITEDDFPEIY